MGRIYKYWFAVVIVLLGCQQKQAPEEAISEENGQLQRLEKEVKVIHDRAMENIEPTMSLKTALKESIELLKEDPSQVDEVILRELLVQNLDEAQQSMMDWMRSYNASMEIKDPKERMGVMAKEKLAIQEVEAKMRSALNAAEEVLKGD